MLEPWNLNSVLLTMNQRIYSPGVKKDILHSSWEDAAGFYGFQRIAELLIMVPTRHFEMLQFGSVCVGRVIDKAIFCKLPRIRVHRLEFSWMHYNGQLADTQNLEGNLLNALSQNGTWLEVINNPDDIFSKVGRDELQRLADRNRDLQAWTSDPAIIEKELKIKLVEEENKTLKHSIRL